MGRKVTAMKFLFMPFSIVAGLVAGFLSKKVFDGIWGLIDEEEPPKPKHRARSTAKLATALAVEGAVFRLVRGLADQGSRRAFAGVTGSWPGEEAPSAR
jgi:hypothetical protein